MAARPAMAAPLAELPALCTTSLPGVATALLCRGDTAIVGTESGTVTLFRLVPLRRGPTLMEQAFVAVGATSAATTSRADEAAAVDGPFEWSAGSTLILRGGVAVDGLEVLVVPTEAGGTAGSEWLLVSCGGEVSAHLLPRLGSVSRLAVACTGAFGLQASPPEASRLPAPPAGRLATAHRRHVVLWSLWPEPDAGAGAGGGAGGPSNAVECAVVGGGGADASGLRASREAAIEVDACVSALHWCGGTLCVEMAAETLGRGQAGGAGACIVVFDVATRHECWRLHAQPQPVASPRTAPAADPPAEALVILERQARGSSSSGGGSWLAAVLSPSPSSPSASTTTCASPSAAASSPSASAHATPPQAPASRASSTPRAPASAAGWRAFPPSAPGPYLDVLSGAQLPSLAATAPPGRCWRGGWRIDFATRPTDADGWEYATAHPPPPKQPKRLGSTEPSIAGARAARAEGVWLATPSPSLRARRRRWRRQLVPLHAEAPWPALLPMPGARVLLGAALQPSRPSCTLVLDLSHLSLAPLLQWGGGGEGGGDDDGAGNGSGGAGGGGEGGGGEGGGGDGGGGDGGGGEGGQGGNGPTYAVARLRAADPPPPAALAAAPPLVYSISRPRGGRGAGSGALPPAHAATPAPGGTAGAAVCALADALPSAHAATYAPGATARSDLGAVGLYAGGGGRPLPPNPTLPPRPTPPPIPTLAPTSLPPSPPPFTPTRFPPAGGADALGTEAFTLSAWDSETGEVVTSVSVALDASVGSPPLLSCGGSVLALALGSKLVAYAPPHLAAPRQAGQGVTAAGSLYEGVAGASGGAPPRAVQAQTPQIGGPAIRPVASHSAAPRAMPAHPAPPIPGCVANAEQVQAANTPFTSHSAAPRLLRETRLVEAEVRRRVQQAARRQAGSGVAVEAVGASAAASSAQDRAHACSSAATTSATALSTATASVSGAEKKHPSGSSGSSSESPLVDLGRVVAGWLAAAVADPRPLSAPFGPLSSARKSSSYYETPSSAGGGGVGGGAGGGGPGGGGDAGGGEGGGGDGGGGDGIGDDGSVHPLGVLLAQRIAAVAGRLAAARASLHPEPSLPGTEIAVAQRPWMAGEGDDAESEAGCTAASMETAPGVAAGSEDGAIAAAAIAGDGGEGDGDGEEGCGDGAGVGGSVGDGAGVGEGGVGATAPVATAAIAATSHTAAAGSEEQEVAARAAADAREAVAAEALREVRSMLERLREEVRLAFTRSCHLQYCMVYAIHTGGRRGVRILTNSRTTVSHQGGQCRWARGMKGWLIRAQTTRSKRISCKGQSRIPFGAVAYVACEPPAILTTTVAGCKIPRKENSPIF